MLLAGCSSGTLCDSRLSLGCLSISLERPVNRIFFFGNILGVMLFLTLYTCVFNCHCKRDTAVDDRGQNPSEMHQHLR